MQQSEHLVFPEKGRETLKEFSNLEAVISEPWDKETSSSFQKAGPAEGLEAFAGACMSWLKFTTQRQ